MPSSTVVLASSVVRSARQGESHGGLFLVELEAGRVHEAMNWNDAGIDWTGRGGDRGLRGIAFSGDHVLVAASDEIFFLDRGFKVVHSVRNQYLRHCHEIAVCGGKLFVTSTGYDSVLVLDLTTGVFTQGYAIRYGWGGGRWRHALGWRARPSVARFDPSAPGGPQAGDTTHVNAVWAHPDGSFTAAGTRLGLLLEIGANAVVTGVRKVPFGTHNARRWGDGVMANLTAQDKVAILDRAGGIVSEVPVPVGGGAGWRPPEGLSTDHARPGFARGLAVIGDAAPKPLVAVGTTPAAICVVDLARGTVEDVSTISSDVRNAIHGLEVWPFPL